MACVQGVPPRGSWSEIRKWLVLTGSGPQKGELPWRAVPGAGKVVPPACSCLHTFSIIRVHWAVSVTNNVFCTVISDPEAAWGDVCSHPRLQQVPASRTREPGPRGHRSDQEPLCCS